MKRFTEDDIEALLADEERAAPPDDLLARIQDEVPERIVVARRPRWWAAPWLAAAAVLALAITGVLFLRSEPVPIELPPAPAPGDVASAAKPPVVAAPSEIPRGEIRAVVKDQSGANVPGARVTVSGERLTEERDAVTNANGVARFEGLPEGDVEIEAELSGFVTDRATARVSSLAGGEVDLTLEVAGVAETVTVAGEAPRVHVVSNMIATSPAPDTFYDRSLPDIPPSTGGTREPNDAVYDRTYFQHYGVHPFVDTEDDPLSTFGLDVDTGSYSIARRFLSDGHLPDPDSVRVEEFVNSFDYDDPPPSTGDFAIRTEGAPTPFAGTARTVLLRFGIRARDADASERKPAVLTFLVDVSGSMNRENRLGLVKKGLGLLIDELRDEDRVGLVVFGTSARKVLEPTPDREMLRRAVSALVPEGSTNLESGLVLAYEMARAHAREDALNRIILCSDGVANEGRTGWESLLELVSPRRDGIQLTAIGFGMGNYNDVLMEQLANHADGSYAYVDDIHEARRVFVARLRSLIDTVARDAKVQVRFEPKSVESYRLLGYENRSLADEDFRDDTKDAGEIGIGHRVSALYEVKLAAEPAADSTLATVTLRYLSVENGETREIEETVGMEEVASSWETASSSLRLAAVVAELAEILRGSYWAQEGSLDQVLAEAWKLLRVMDDRQDLIELVDLVGKAAESR